ncbi:hypothetical protein [Sphingomonas sp. MMS24-J13]|uniref:hypothetical protein n=1 Tax=Sphingomonas sp. MMS24-J13 TaxID=3238686 RepID=UPI00384B969E
MAEYSYNDRPARRTNTVVIVGVVVLLLIVAAIVFQLVSVRQTQSAELPTVRVEGGQAPAFKVKTADVDVGSKSVAVDVPKVSVDTTTTKVSVPTVHVKKPGE